MEKNKYLHWSDKEDEHQVLDIVAVYLNETDNQMKNNEKRETRRHVSVERLEDAGFILPDENVNIESIVVNRERRHDIISAIRKLKPKQQVVVVKRFFQDKTLKQIAQEEGITKEAVFQRLLTAIKKLKKILKKP